MTVEKLLITQFVNYINACIESQVLDMPDYITIGTPFYSSGAGLWVQILGNATPSQKYLRGKYHGSLPFALYYRLSSAELDGIEAKMLIPSENMEAYLFGLQVANAYPTFDGFIIKEITQTKGANPFRKDQDGTIIYQSLWTIDFEVI